MPYIHTMQCTILITTVVAFIGCSGRGEVIITGTITNYNPRTDSVFVTLTRNWESILRAPKRFDIQKSGKFELEFDVGRFPPPVTFIKNRKLYARLILKSLWEPSPAVIDEVRNKVFDVKLKGKGVFTIQVRL